MSSDNVEVPTIGHLIRAALDEGRSVRDLEHDSGYRVRFQTFQELSTHAPRQFPKETKTISGLAQALRITETSVVLAYAQSLGVPVETRSSFAMRLPPAVDELDIDVQNALISVVRAVSRRSHRVVSHDAEVPNWGRGIRAGASGEDARVRRNEQSG